MYSVIVDGRVEDVSYKNMDLGDVVAYAVYVGEAYAGQVFKMRNGRWSAVSKTPHDLTPIDGFATRELAMRVILKIEGYH